MGTVRIDVAGGGNDFSRSVEVDTEKVVSSFKIDLASGEISVHYKRSEGGEKLKLVEAEGEKGGSEETLLGVVAPVDEKAHITKGGNLKVSSNKEVEKEIAKNSGMKSDPDGNTAKVKTDETKLDS